MQVLFFVSNVIFVLYFLMIGVWRLGAVPLIAMLALMFGGGVPLLTDGRVSEHTWTVDSVHEFVTNHALVIAWSLVVLGGRGMLDIYANLGSEHIFWLLGMHIVLRLGSYIYNYRDGIQIFHVGYYLSALLMFWVMRGLVDMTTLIHLMMAFVVMTMAIYAFIIFVIGAVGRESTAFDKYMLFVLFNISVIILIYLRGRDDLPSAVILSQIYLMAMYVIVYGVQRYYRQIHDDVIIDQNHLVEEILDGKKILGGRNIPFVTDVVIQAQKFISGLNKNTTSR